MNTFLALAILILGVLAYALVNSIEIAIIAADRIRVKHMAEQGSLRARSLERLRSDRDHFFAGIVLLQNLFVVLASAMASVISVESFGGIGLVFGTVLMTLLLAVVGEVTPKVLAARVTERYALLVAPPIEWLISALRPLVWAIAAAPRGLGRLLFGSALGATPTVTEAEFRTLIDIGTSEKAFEEETGELLERVFQFRDRQVQEIMVPRTEVVFLETGMNVGDFYRVFDETPLIPAFRYTRTPSTTSSESWASRTFCAASAAATLPLPAR